MNKTLPNNKKDSELQTEVDATNQTLRKRTKGKENTLAEEKKTKLVKALLDPNVCPQCDLNGADLTEADL